MYAYGLCCAHVKGVQAYRYNTHRQTRASWSSSSFTCTKTCCECGRGGGESAKSLSTNPVHRVYISDLPHTTPFVHSQQSIHSI
jgi:hypothetical protein